ncbi:MAG: ABC transporter permease [Clostridia bacterium]|nr:ABC transporter permease [Clostridia bacterium]
MEKTFEKNTFTKRLKSMLKVDTRRLFISPFFYIMVGIAFVVPILILVMTTMMDGTVSTNPQTGQETVIHGFDYVWQILGSVSSSGGSEQAGMSMDLVSMCNINMMYFAIAVLVCVFVCDDFRSGYAKNLFTVRAKKTDYVISKTIVSSIGGGAMILAFVLGSIIGGAIASLSFEMVGFNAFNLICSIISKVLLVPIFVSIFLTMSVIGKQKSWLAICLSLGVGMFLFMVISIASPLDAGIIHIILCSVGSIGFAVGMGAISNAVLKKTSLV